MTRRHIRVGMPLSTFLQVPWRAGAPEKSFWTGTKVSWKLIIPIGTLRCDSCGYLESYARDEFAAR